MNMRAYVSFILLIFIWIGFSFGQQNASIIKAGTLVETSPFVFPAYEDQYSELKEIFTKETYPRFSESPDLELLNMTYMSDGLKIVGFLYKPRVTEGREFPLIIMNRWGFGIHGQVRPRSIFIYEMFRLASEGFVVIMTQYRGSGGSEGKDIIGITDMVDLRNLMLLIQSLDYVDMKNIYMHGLSRGGLVTLLAIKEGFPIRAAVIVGSAGNIVELSEKDTILLDYFPENFNSNKEIYCKNVTANLWVDKLDVPLLIFHGGEDGSISPAYTLSFAQKLQEHDKLYELIIYSKDGHNTHNHREERLLKTIDWFKYPRTIPIRKPIRSALKKGKATQAIELYKKLIHFKFGGTQDDWACGC